MYPEKLEFQWWLHYINGIQEGIRRLNDCAVKLTASYSIQAQVKLRKLTRLNNI